MKLSKKSQTFLEDLRLYLVASGKDEREIEDIVSELEDHLYEAEKDGKDVDHLIGKSPKEYMEQIAGEMSFDKKGWLKYIPVLILGVYAYILLGEAIRGGVQYSLLKIAGDFFIIIISLLLFSGVAKYIASHRLSKFKEGMLFALLGIMPISLFVGVIFLDHAIDSPEIIFNQTGNILTVVLCIGLFIGMALWSKTSVPIIIPAILYLPEGLLGLTDLRLETRLITQNILVFSGLIIFFFIIFKKERKEG